LADCTDANYAAKEREREREKEIKIRVYLLDKCASRKYVSLTTEASIFDFGFSVVKSRKRINVHYVHLCIYVCRYCESSASMTALRLISFISCERSAMERRKIEVGVSTLKEIHSAGT